LISRLISSSSLLSLFLIRRLFLIGCVFLRVGGFFSLFLRLRLLLAFTGGFSLFYYIIFSFFRVRFKLDRNRHHFALRVDDPTCHEVVLASLKRKPLRNLGFFLLRIIIIAPMCFPTC